MIRFQVMDLLNCSTQHFLFNCCKNVNPICENELLELLNFEMRVVTLQKWNVADLQMQSVKLIHLFNHYNIPNEPIIIWLINSLISVLSSWQRKLSLGNPT